MAYKRRQENYAQKTVTTQFVHINAFTYWVSKIKRQFYKITKCTVIEL